MDLTVPYHNLLLLSNTYLTGRYYLTYCIPRSATPFGEEKRNRELKNSNAKYREPGGPQAVYRTVLLDTTTPNLEQRR
jgi:hypothetical protein